MLPKDIEAALDDIDDPGSAYSGGPCVLPLPGLRVAGLADPISLPLLPIQAEQLASIARVCPHGKGLETVVDKTVRDCLEIDASAVTFGNAGWQHALNELVKKAAGDLGVPGRSVRGDLYKLLLYREGGHFKPHRDTEKREGMFATLTIQLPSRFKGGELVVRHQGTEETFESGAENGNCEFSSYYTTFFADVEHELLPVTEGYRLALVYSMSWVGRGEKPTTDRHKLSNVKVALMDYAAKNSCGAWSLCFGLKHQYTNASLDLGIAALKGSDRSTIASLSTAANLAGMGDLEILLVRLERVDMESGEADDYEFECMDTEKGDVKVAEKYTADGVEYDDDLTFMDWNSLSEDGLRLELEDEGSVEYTGNEGATRETFYGTLVALIWPKEKTVEIRFSSDANLAQFLEDDLQQLESRVDRVLTWMEGRRGYENTWSSVEMVLALCLENSLLEHSLRAVKVAAEVISNTPTMSKLVSSLTRKFGWPNVAEAVKTFLCPHNVSYFQTMVPRAESLNVLQDVVPVDVGIQAFARIVWFLEVRQPLEDKIDLMTQDLVRYVDSNWGKHLSHGVSSRTLSPEFSKVIVTLNGKAREPEVRAAFDALITRFSKLCKKLGEVELQIIERGFSENITAGAPKTTVTSLLETIQTRLSALVAERFVAAVDDMIPRMAPQTMNDGDGYQPRLWNISRNEWDRFLRFAESVMSRDENTSDVKMRFNKLLSEVCKMDKDGLACLKCCLSSRYSQVAALDRKVLYPLRAEVERCTDIVEKAEKLEQISTLEEATREKPKKVQTKYPKFRGGPRADVISFMRSEEVEMQFRGFTSVVIARKVLASLQRFMPAGMTSGATGSGARSYFWLRKPFAAEWEKWKQYERDLHRLADARLALERIERRARDASDEGVHEPGNKKRKLSDVVVVESD